jgi:hypothetical protein
MFHLLLSSVSSSSDASLKHGQESRPHHQFQKRKNQFQTQKKKKKRSREEKGGGGDAKKNRLFSSAAEYQIVY